MSGRGGDGGAPRRQASGAATFELERFAWGSPDRLELSGRFEGLAGMPEGAPALVVQGAGGRHRLPAAPNAPWPPEAGEAWQAAFVWQNPPAPFDAAELQLGGGLAVELPRPGSHRRRVGRRALPVRGSGDAAPAPSENGREAAATDAGQGELEVARREAQEAQTSVAAAHAELVRAREELEAERRRRTTDAERFRRALESMRQVAEQTVGAEEGGLAQLDAQLEAADAKLDADALEQLHGQLESALGSWAPEHEELERLRERNASLQDAATATKEAREERDVARGQVEELRGEVERMRHALEAKRRECDQLRARLEAIREAVAETR